MQQAPVHAHVLLREQDARLEAVVRPPLQRVDVSVAVAQDGEAEGLEAVVEVLEGVVLVGVEHVGVVVWVEVLFYAFLCGEGSK